MTTEMTTLAAFLDECGITPTEAETLIRLALTTAESAHTWDDEVAQHWNDPYQVAVASFSEPDRIDALTNRAAAALYGPDQRDAEIGA